MPLQRGALPREAALTGCATPGTPPRTSAGSPTCTRRATRARRASSSCSTRPATRMQPGDRVLLIVPESGPLHHGLRAADLRWPRRRAEPGGAGGDPRSASRRPATRPAVARVLGELAEVWAELQRDPGPGAGRPADRGRLGDARGLPQAAAQPAPAGGRRRPVDLARRRELLRRAVLAAQRRHQARRRRAPRLPAARTRLRGSRRRPGADGRPRARTSAHAALSAFVFHRAGPARPGRPAWRDVRHRGPRRAERGRLGGPACRAASACATTSSASCGTTRKATASTSGCSPPRCAPVLFDDAAMTRIVKTARVTARLYALQLEELDMSEPSRRGLRTRALPVAGHGRRSRDPDGPGHPAPGDQRPAAPEPRPALPVGTGRCPGWPSRSSSSASGSARSGSPRTPRWTGCACGSCAGSSPRTPSPC